MRPTIAITGLACRYPDASSPDELWQNVLAQRRAFRRIPPERLAPTDYFHPDRTAPDRTYSTQAAVIEGYEFDRVAYRVVGTTYRAADLAHWLTLDVATRVLEDAGFPQAEGLDRSRVGVLLGNTLTGEFSRAATLRLRWPYVRRVVEAQLVAEDAEHWTPERRAEFLARLEATFKAPFPPVGDETLAGGLSNTIAGRVCNQFDLGGGGYTVDGACSSSLLALAHACDSLTAGDLDAVLVGGVDLSLDPFELVGFAKVGALAAQEMRVYDARAAGFWPGEGCGFALLMREEDARARGRKIYALVRGWGISSDGSGGISRPETEGQLRAIRRAYARAGYGADTVNYFEGHGTGTTVGDAVELRTLGAARREAGAQSPAVVGSVKANIGHTKAAAGIAGLIKAVMAVHTRWIPPNTGVEIPHPELEGDPPLLRVTHEGEPWPSGIPRRAGVSSMGFGGINAHVTVEGIEAESPTTIPVSIDSLVRSSQDAELFLFAADADALPEHLEKIRAVAPQLSRSDLTDLAVHLQKEIAEKTPPAQSSVSDTWTRAAMVASRAEELTEGLDRLLAWLREGVTQRIDSETSTFLGTGNEEPRIGFLFPGQGSPSRRDGGALERRFEWAQELFARAPIPPGDDLVDTALAQPAIVTASLAGLRWLQELGIEGDFATGHSLGELTSLHWGGAMDEPTLLRVAAGRGRAMSDLSESGGAMAQIRATPFEVRALLDEVGDAHGSVLIAGHNSPRQTAVSGTAPAVDAAIEAARERKWSAVRLKVSHAFHSPLVAPAANALRDRLQSEHFAPLRRTVVSTVRGGSLEPDEDVCELLVHQLTNPVRFVQAMQEMAPHVDLLLEVGPGRVLSDLAGRTAEVPVVATDAGGSSLAGLLAAIGACHAMGQRLNLPGLYENRFVRPFELLEREMRFFANPCEEAPRLEDGLDLTELAQSFADTKETTGDTTPREVARQTGETVLDVVRRLVAERAELPAEAVSENLRLLEDLHLNSISVGQVVVEASQALGLKPPASPSDFADATVGKVAKALEELEQRTEESPETTETAHEVPSPPGVRSWVRAFTVECVERASVEPEPRERPAEEHAEHAPADASHEDDASAWDIFAPDDDAWAQALGEALADEPGSGVVLGLPSEPDATAVSAMLAAARAALAKGGHSRFVLVGSRSYAPLARTLHLETRVTTCVVEAPFDHPRFTEWVVAEMRAADGFVEVHYDGEGTRRQPILRHHRLEEAPEEIGLDASDLLLVTGGGKGIAAECALALAQRSKVRLVLMGRSNADADPALAQNLERLKGHGVEFHYVAADVVDPAAVRAALASVQAECGPITAVLHGAGRNEPRTLSHMTEEDFLATLAPKIDGLRNVLACVDPGQMRLLVTFGSIIARVGLAGEADYAIANEWLARETERFGHENGGCRCLCLEWSLWSGVGMGERLGRVDALIEQGVHPITADEGVDILLRVLSQPQCPTRLVITSRFTRVPTLAFTSRELPLLRFLERPRVHYPDVELVVDCELSPTRDPYLDDHVFRGTRILPTVMGLEAMAQVATAVTGHEGPVAIEDLQLLSPVPVPDGGTVMRIAALVTRDGDVEVVIRDQQSDFQADDFRAVVRFQTSSSEREARKPVSLDPDSACPPESAQVTLDPRQDLYDRGLFFQGERFQRVQRYRRLRSQECWAEITAVEGQSWFGAYLPQNLLLGDPGARDATLHAIQPCVPEISLLPVGAARWIQGPAAHEVARIHHAVERSTDGRTFVYDVEVRTPDGRLCERWEGLRLRTVPGTEHQGDWCPGLLGPYVERRVISMLSDPSLKIALEPNGGMDRNARTDRLVRHGLGIDQRLSYRPDGKPELTDGHHISAAHTGDVTLAVTSSLPVGCDLEQIVPRDPQTWQGLIGEQHVALAELLARDADHGDAAAASTRIWATAECLKKAGGSPTQPLSLVSAGEDGWVVLAGGGMHVATLVTRIEGVTAPVVLAVVAGAAGAGRAR